MKMEGKKTSDIASEFGVDETTVRRQWRWLKQGRGFYYNAPKSGRPRALQGDDYERFIATAENDEWEDVPDLLRRTGAPIGRTTARRYLHSNNFVTRRKVDVPLISEGHAKKNGRNGRTSMQSARCASGSGCGSVMRRDSK